MRRPGVRPSSAPPIKSTLYGEALLAVFASGAMSRILWFMMRKKADTYIPALSRDWLTPLYDSLIGWTMPEYAFKLRLIEQARIKSNHFVLDLGCGTGTLTRLIK